MKKYILALTLTLGVVIPVCAQEAVISSYYLDTDNRDCWLEMLVIEDNVDMRGWKLRASNANQSAFEDWIKFDNAGFWNHMRAGTVIIIYSTSASSSGTAHAIDTNKTDGSVQVHAQMTNLFNLGGTTPWIHRPTGQLLDLHDDGPGDGGHIHALGHNSGSAGANFTGMPTPKLNHQQDGTTGKVVVVWPGGSLNRYSSSSSGTTWTRIITGSTRATFALPNDSSTALTNNSEFWQSVRQPLWSSPSFNVKTGPAGDYDTLSWNKATDPYPADSTQGYMVLRNTVNTFSAPEDGHTYQVGDAVGPAKIIGIIRSSQINTFVDNTFPDCNLTYYYRIYAFRYVADLIQGNDYHDARGRAYNEDDYSSGSMTPKKPGATAINHY